MNPCRYKKKLVAEANKMLTEEFLALSAKKDIEKVPAHIYQNFAPSIGIGEITKNKNFGIFERSPYYEKKKEICGIHIKGTEKTKRARVSDKLKQVSNYSSINDHTFKNGNKFKNDCTQDFNSQYQRLTLRSFKIYKSRNNILTWISKLYRKSKGSVNISFLRLINVEITSDVRIVNIKSDGCFKQVNCTDGMANVGSNIQTVKQAVRRSRHNFIFISKQHKTIYILQLVSRPQGREGTPEDNNTDNYKQVLEDCNMALKLLELSIEQPLLLQITSAIPISRGGKRRDRYNFAQQRFLKWKRSKNLIDSISVAQIVNHLAEIYFTDKFKPNTIKAYKSAILGLVKNPMEKTNQKIFTDSNSETLIKNLTSKLTWMLAVTELLRFSNIYRIDDAPPKEKKGRQPAERPYHIEEHSNPIMCLVIAYREYKYRFATTPCITSHINNSFWTVENLLHQDITIPKTQAIGDTLASQAKASENNIVNHAFWLTI
ncbi:hypothetical protein BB561_003725 [Smittium simulii]|uniref:Uncharacterized protein n=1 Tax=Smittium simulii TaxID=133385 RepID=A0A2T9YJW0_9FUNG|nr:hypothetical protein BB561_003725 [Smittium simulii]